MLLYSWGNDIIIKNNEKSIEVIKGKVFINLDFLGNLGHSIVKHKDDRMYKGNVARLEDGCRLFYLQIPYKYERKI